MTMIKESMHTIESNKCNVTVRLLSVTLDHEGLYRCRDRITTKWSDHRLEVGGRCVQSKVKGKREREREGERERE